MNVSRNLQERYVAARITRQKNLTEQNFTLKQYGTWEEAERAAKAWIKDVLPTLPPPISSKDRMTKRNRSGVVGVYWSRGLVKRPNGRRYEYPCWVARWPGCKFKGGLSWSVNQFEDDAFVLAVLARRLESINRAAILTAFDTIAGKKEYRDILSLLKL